MYRIKATFQDKEWYLQSKGVPNRTLLSSDFLWIGDIASATEYSDVTLAVKWFMKLMKNVKWTNLTLERLIGEKRGYKKG